MSYPVKQLISEAYFTSGIVARGFQEIAGDQEEVGLLKLNEILSDTAIEDNLVPYFTTKYNFFGVPGQEKYFIPNLDQLETFVFYIDNVRFSSRKKNQDRYFGDARIEQIETLPFNWHSERCFGGTNLFLYFPPDLQYPMNVTGRFRLNNVLISDDLSSPIATVNLGSVLFTGSGASPLLPAVLLAGQFVINNVDLMGSYNSIQQFVSAIDPSLYPIINYQGELILTSYDGNSINLVTNGSANVPTISFVNFNTTSGALNQTFIAIQLDQYYINYLQYRLADLLCISYNFKTPDNLRDKLKAYMDMISKKSSPIDLTVTKISTLGRNESVNWAQVNLGHGWTV
jgi:hypothetical protein